jgi:CheY-like chemotaxis protein
MTNPANAAGEPQGPVVLVVENDSLVQRLAQTVLSQHGYQVRIVGDGREAVEVYRTRTARIDVVLMDLNLPVLSGLEVAEQLRQIDAQVRIVLTSGAPPEDLATPYRFVPKPYRPAELLAAVAAARQGEQTP